MFERILVAVDGSEYGFAALEQALELAEDLGSTVHVLHVIDARLTKLPYILAALPTSLAPEVGSAWVEWATQVTEGLRALGEAILEHAKSRCAEAQIPCQTELEEGNVSRVILERARHADVIVMGRKGAGARVGGPLLGSSFEAIVRHAPVPVLGVQREARPLRRLLVAYDGSERAEDALHVVIELARHRDRAVILLTVDDGHEGRRRAFEAARRHLEEAGVPFEALFRSGHPAEVILETADETSSDLIAMGAYGHRRFLEILFGSTVDDVMRRTTLPILIVR